MSIFKNKRSIEAKVGQIGKRKIVPVGAWENYRKVNRYSNPKAKGQPRELQIEIKDLSLAYEGRSIIGGLSFELYSGDYLCIIGENGSGKTTLMNAILGLKKPASGEIVFYDLKRNQIGVLPQKTPVQNDFPALVSEIVLSGLVGKKKGIAFYTKNDKRTAFSSMEKLGITSIKDRSFRELSGGQQQRCLLARALCAAQKLIVLDEPTAGLDPRASADMYKLISDVNREQGMTVIMISHDVESALEYATHILRIGSTSVFFGTRDEFLMTAEGAALLCDCKKQKKSGLPYGESDAYKYRGGESYDG